MADKNILITIVAGIGDFIESINALRNIRDALPESKISLLVSSKAYDYAKLSPYADEVYSFPVSRGRGFSFDAISKISDSIKLMNNLRKRRFDTAVFLFEVSTYGGAALMALFFKAIGVKNIFGRDTDGRGWFFSKKIADNTSDSFNQAHYFNKAAQALTAIPVSGQSLPWVGNKDVENVSKFLSGCGITATDKVMLINPGSDRLSRRWPLDNFAKTAGHFAVKHSFVPIIVGNEREQDVANKLIGLCGITAFSAAGKLTIGGLVELTRRSKILFTTNSAAMHIAGICGIPFIAVAGSGNPLRDKPSGDDSKMSLLWKEVGCNPCDYWKCPKKPFMECMKAITPEEVIKAGELMLARIYT